MGTFGALVRDSKIGKDITPYSDSEQVIVNDDHTPVAILSGFLLFMAFMLGYVYYHSPLHYYAYILSALSLVMSFHAMKLKDFNTAPSINQLDFHKQRQ